MIFIFWSIHAVISMHQAKSFVLYVQSSAGESPCYCTRGVQIDSWEVEGVLSWQSRDQLSFITPSPAAARQSRGSARPQWHVSARFLTGMYQLDRLASQKVFHQDPNILCNHRHCDTQRQALALVSGDWIPRKPLSLPKVWDFVFSFSFDPPPPLFVWGEQIILFFFLLQTNTPKFTQVSFIS